MKLQDKKYNYTIKITGVTDNTTFKTMSGILADMYDVNPTFNDATDVITVSKADWVSQTTASAKLSAAGYTLQSYTYVLVVVPASGATR